MTRVTYTILEYTESELVEVGTPFALLLWDSADFADFTLFFLREWRNLVSATNERDREHIQDFIYELHQLRFRPPHAVSDFFASVQDLSVGSLRTSLSRTIEISVAKRRVLGIDNRAGEVVPCETEQFLKLIAALSPHSPMQGGTML